MTAFAIDMRAGVLGDGVIARQEDGTAGSEPGEDRRHIAACQRERRPAIPREDAVVAGRVPRGQTSHDAEQVGDGASAQGEDRGQGQEDESPMGGPREGRLQGVKHRADLLGKLLMNRLESSPCRPRLLRLLTSHGADPLLELDSGESPGTGIEYTGHGSLRGCEKGLVSYPSLHPGGLLLSNRQKRQESS